MKTRAFGEVWGLGMAKFVVFFIFFDFLSFEGFLGSAGTLRLSAVGLGF